MPSKPTKEQRFKWHIEHAKHCDCRKMTDKLKAEIAQWKKTQKNLITVKYIL
jgi:hypothetical protein